MLRLPLFRYSRPSTLEEAVELLAAEGAAEGRARVVAGGTDLWPNMKRRHQRAEAVVSLLGIERLRGVSNGEELTIGATTTLAEIEHHPTVLAGCPALATAAGAVSSPPLRNMGTIGGNLCVDTRCTYYNQTEEWRRSIDYCMKEAGEICWVAPSSPRCWAHSASDTAPMLIALGAEVELTGPDGSRRLSVEGLYRNDGIDYLARRPGEILTSVRVPARSLLPRCRAAFWKLRRRGSIDFAVLSVAAALWPAEDGTTEAARVVLGAVASQPVVADRVATALIGERPEAEIIDAAASLARKPATPMDNTDFQAQWRGVMVERYTAAALKEAAGLPVERLAPKHRRYGPADATLPVD